MKLNKLTPFKWYVLQNFPFIEEDFDAITNWQLFCKLGDELNKTINNVNILGTQVETLTDYVNNYFENLDVQEEINNKLDDMAESGELEEIIATYINLNSVLCFDTVDDMKNATNLINGSFAKTLGYYSINDGGDGLYKIRNVTVSDNVDEGLLIAIGDSFVAELIYNNNTVNLKQFGAKGDNETDETDILQNAINNVPNGTTILIPDGEYVITDKIIMPNTSNNKYVILEGKHRDYSKLKFNLSDSTLDCAIEMKGTGTDVLNKCVLKNLRIENIKENDTSETNGINLNYNLQVNCLENISITKFYDNINLGNRNWSFTIKNVHSTYARRDGIHAQGIINNVHFVGCDLMYNKNANILLQGAMNCSIENTDFSVYEDGTYGAYINYCNSINILNCYFESATDCTEILAGIFVNNTIGFFIDSIDFSINSSREDYKPVHILNSNCTRIEGFNFSNTNTNKAPYGIYYDSGYEHELGSAYFKNVTTCVYLTVADLHITGGLKIDSSTVIKTIETSATGFVFGRIRGEIYRKSQIHNTAKSGCHLQGNAKTEGNTANRPLVFAIGQVYRDTQIDKIIFGKEMPTFDSNGDVVSGNTWVDVNNENV